VRLQLHLDLDLGVLFRGAGICLLPLPWEPSSTSSFLPAEGARFGSMRLWLPSSCVVALLGEACEGGRGLVGEFEGSRGEVWWSPIGPVGFWFGEDGESVFPRALGVGGLV
jgi:hypothetical protein